MNPMPGAGCLLLSFLLAGCEENLPPRKDPAEYLQASFTTQTRLIALDEYNIRQPRMVLRLSIRNLYDEVLQDTARVRGDVRLYLLKRPDIIKTFVWGEGDVQTPGVVKGWIATLRPNSEVMLASAWDQMSDRDSIFWKFGRYTKKFDNQGNPYLESDSLYFVAEGRIQLFKYGPAIKAPRMVFGIIYKLLGFGTIPE